MILSQCLNLGKTELCVSTSQGLTLCSKESQLTESQPLHKSKSLGIKKGFLKAPLNKLSNPSESTNKNLNIISKIPFKINNKNL